MPPANMTILYHSNRPEGQTFDLTAEMATKLEAEGWVDTPAKLPGKANGPSSQMPSAAIAREAPVAMSAGDGRALGELPIAAVDGGDILRSSAARGRIGQIMDADYDLICNVPGDTFLEDNELQETVEQMSFEELVECITRLNGAGDYLAMSAEDLRLDLLELIRPLNQALASEAPEPVAEATGTSAATAEEEDPTNWTVDKLKEASVEVREAWMEEATAVLIRERLDELEVAYKSRDSKDELKAHLRAALDDYDATKAEATE
jgi:hypothetical protein